MAEQLYNNVLKDYNNYQTCNSTYFTYLNTLKAISEQGFFEIIDKYENEVREFSINLLVNSDYKFWLNCHNNSKKDFWNYIQSVCGLVENETHRKCSVCETFEEAKIKITEEQLNYIDNHTRFHRFPDGAECMFRISIYFTITDQIPENTEPKKHDDWFLCDIKDLKNQLLTDSLKLKLNKIIDSVGRKCTSLKRNSLVGTPTSEGEIVKKDSRHGNFRNE
ncbi:8872_t:CDS:2 [Dentiscutata erythropus]|uniref:8872_t:CDS:1 n=1 Tax=Dentiscutata erythropus TaxID=1348616 RepID=A0A9N9H730_9GLOM|nr:8872_t:CDS:2 [Dentiscutata erythropus]